MESLLFDFSNIIVDKEESYNIENNVYGILYKKRYRCIKI